MCWHQHCICINAYILRTHAYGSPSSALIYYMFPCFFISAAFTPCLPKSAGLDCIITTLFLPCRSSVSPSNTNDNFQNRSQTSLTRQHSILTDGSQTTSKSTSKPATYPHHAAQRTHTTAARHAAQLSRKRKSQTRKHQMQMNVPHGLPSQLLSSCSSLTSTPQSLSLLSSPLPRTSRFKYSRQAY